MFLICSTLLSMAPLQIAEERQVPLAPQVLEAANSLGINLPNSVPANWQDLVAAPTQSTTRMASAPWPTVDWSVSTPQAQGMDEQQLRQAFQYGISQSSNALLVIRNGYIVAEWYAPNWAQDDREDSYSMSKSITSGLYGAALLDGIYTNPNQKVSLEISEWNDPAHQDVRVRHLLSMNSGLHWDFITDYLLLGFANDQSQFAIDLGMDATPGTTWVYNNSACQVLSEWFLRRSGMQIGDYFQMRVASVIGMNQATWMTDNVGNTLTYRSVFASAREFAKFGYLFLRNGEWDGTQIIPPRWIQVSTRPSQSDNPFYGLLWWLNTGALDMPNVPADAYYAAGLGEKRIYVVPSQDLVVIRLGPGAGSWEDNAFLGPISQSVQ